MTSFHIAKQPAIMLILGFITAAIIFTGSMFYNNKQTIKITGMIFATIIFLSTCFKAYVTNCAIIGKCTTLAWFLVVLYAIICMLIIYMYYKYVH